MAKKTTAGEPRVRLGIVGAGTMGARAGGRITRGEIPGFTVVGIADVDDARRENSASVLGVAGYASVESLIEEASPDALYIATPDHLHRAPCLAAAAAKVPFLVEKPLATTIEDAEAIADAAAGMVAEVNFSNRWNPPFVTAKSAVDAGRLGTFSSLAARLDNTVTSPAENLAWAARTTSAWFLISHCLDLAYWLHGRRARTVYATGSRGILEARGIDTWDSIHALVNYEGGGTGSFESVWVLPKGHPTAVEFTFRLVGDVGAVTVDTSQQHVTVTDHARASWPGTLNWTAARFRAFADALDGGTAGVPIADGVENTRILVALHRSLDSGTVERV